MSLSMIRAAPYAVAIAAVLGAMLWAYSQGRAACEAAHRAERLKQIEAGERLEEERRSVASERAALTIKLSEERNADPVIVHRCLGPERVWRLEAIRKGG